MSASIVIPHADEFDELAAPMTDREHADVFGWAWDDLDAAEVEA